MPTEEGAMAPCSISRTEAGSLIKPDVLLGSGDTTAPFFVTEDALKQLQPSVGRNEESLPLAFDTQSGHPGCCNEGV